MEEIDIRELFQEGNLYVGQYEDQQAVTGITVVLAPTGMPAGLDVRGGGPASRDTRILDPLATADLIHAIVLAGGSAFGLDAAGGVMRFLEERGVGLDVGVSGVKVPLVCQSDIFDLGIGSSQIRPDAAMAYKACEAAYGILPAEAKSEKDPEGSPQNASNEWESEQESVVYRGNYRNGSYGAGCGATVGKICGPAFMQKSGIGSAAFQVGALKVGAMVVVNALGDVVDPSTGNIIAGVHAQDGSFAHSIEMLLKLYEAAETMQADSAVTNTTIGIIFTNAALNKAQLCKVAGMGHDGMARAVRPVHTSMDGDSLYAVSLGEVKAPLDVVGTLAAEAVAHAICRAVSAA